MPPKYIDRAYETVSNTPGTASAFSLNGAVEGHMTLAAAGAVDADTFDYVAVEGAKMEIGTGTYTATGTSLSRDTIHQSTNGGAAEDFTSDVKVFVTIRGVNLGGGSGLIPISKTTASSVAAVDLILSGGYSSYVVKFSDVKMQFGNRQLGWRASYDSGSSFDAGVSDYSHMGYYHDRSSDPTIVRETDDAGYMHQLAGNDVGERVSGVMEIFQGTADQTIYVTARVLSRDGGGELNYAHTGSYRSKVGAIDQIRLLFNSGNIESGDFHLYGIADGA